MKEKMKEDFRKFSIGQPGISGTAFDDYMKYQNSSTPYIIEEREMNVTQMDIFSRLMKDRIIWISGGVEERMSSIIQAQLMFLENLDSKSDIKMYIDTPGGSVPHGLGIVDVMELVSPDIETTNTGMCASMGSILLAAGTKGKRSSLRFSKVMTHQVSHGNGGNIQDTRINQLEAEKYNYILFSLLGQYTGKTMKEVLEFSKRDKWYTSDEAKDFGLIDNVILPSGSKSVKDLLKGFNKYYKDEVFNDKTLK